VPAFGSADVQVPLTATGTPSTQQVTATVTTTDGTAVTGAPTTAVTSTLADEDTSLALDAGTTTSPVFSGYSRLSNEPWVASRGYGWVGSPPQSRDRGAPDALTRDIVTDRAPATLRLAVPPGAHAVDLLVGDHSFASDPMSVTADGATVVTVDPAVPAGSSHWYRFQVDGGTSGRTVDLGFAARDAGAYWRFASLLVEK
jgi:hypothetical protein